MDYRTMIGMARIISDHTPPVAPDDYDQDEKRAYYEGWRDGVKQFEESLLRDIVKETVRTGEWK